MQICFVKLNFKTYDDEEDDRGVAKHTEAMKRQLSRGTSWEQVSDRMVHRLSARRELVNLGMKTSEILDNYPALKDQT